jgi:hypothetical protein
MIRRRFAGPVILAVATVWLMAAPAAFGQCTASFAGAVNYGVGNSPRCVALGDINGDGRLDLGAANEVSSNVSIRLGNGDGTFGSMNNYSVGSGPRFVGFADLNADGRPDLVSVNNGNSTVSGGWAINGTFQSFKLRRGRQSVCREHRRFERRRQAGSRRRVQ